MKNNFFKRINQDERIKTQIYKFGYEAFCIISLILAGRMTILSFIYDVNFAEVRFDFILLMLGGGYFIARSAFGGIFSMPAKQKEKRSVAIKVIYGNIALGLLMGTITTIKETLVYKGGELDVYSIYTFGISGLSAMVMGLAVTGIFLLVSNYWANKGIDE